MKRPDYCPCNEEKPDPCPACGATVSGNDRVRGVCQALYMGPEPRDYNLRLTLIDKRTGRDVFDERWINDET